MWHRLLLMVKGDSVCGKLWLANETTFEEISSFDYWELRKYLLFGANVNKRVDDVDMEEDLMFWKIVKRRFWYSNDWNVIVYIGKENMVVDDISDIVDMIVGIKMSRCLHLSGCWKGYCLAEMCSVIIDS